MRTIVSSICIVYAIEMVKVEKDFYSDAQYGLDI